MAAPGCTGRTQEQRAPVTRIVERLLSGSAKVSYGLIADFRWMGGPAPFGEMIGFTDSNFAASKNGAQLFLRLECIP
jgi:hypothetical protein